jgi:hypothetical protein
MRRYRSVSCLKVSTLPGAHTLVGGCCIFIEKRHNILSPNARNEEVTYSKTKKYDLFLAQPWAASIVVLIRGGKRA